MRLLEDTRQAAVRKDLSDANASLRLSRPRQRIDTGLAVVLATTALVGMAGAWLAASWLDVSGRLDPPVIADVEDPRILTDYRDNPSPMVDLVAIGDDLLIGRQDGSIDVFDTKGRLFGTESLPRNAALSSDLALLSVDCPQGTCADGQGETAYALTAEGGLAARRDGDWQVVLGDMAFIGVDGTRVEQADLRGWAVSDDGSLVLADAGEKGLGLFDQRDGSWQTAQQIAGVTHGPLFHQGAFWMGSPAGLHQVTTAGGRAQWSTGVMPGTEGEIIDLAPGAGGADLLALRRAACADGAAGCLSLLQIGRGGDVSILLQEVEANTDLNDSGLKHVVMQGADLLALGTAGVHRYEAAARRWLLVDPQEPTAWFAETDGERLHVALPDRVITLAQGRIGAEVTLEMPLVQILPGDAGALFGLDRQGRILSLTAPAATVLAVADSGVPADVRFTTALALNQLFVAMGPQGVLIHDTKTRRYSFIPPQAMPPLPLADAILVPADGVRIWLVSRSDGSVWSLTVEGDFPAKQIVAEAKGTAGMAVVQARRNGGMLELIGREGQVLRLASDGSFGALAGDPLPGRFSPVSVTTDGAQFVFTDGAALWAYRPGARGWIGPVGPPQGTRLTDLSYGSDRLFALDDAGMVHALGETDWQAVSGGPQKAAFGSEALQDAMAAGSALYLATNDQVQRYLPSERRFDQMWQKPGGAAEILAVQNSMPLWTNSAGLYLGEQEVYGGSDFVDGWLGASGPVALGQTGGSFYLAGPGGCLFLGQSAPTDEIRDVVQLDASRLLVRTTAGAGIYEPELHRWLSASIPGLTPESRLLRLGAHLVRLDPDGLASIPIASIPQIESCDVTSVTFEWPVSASGVQASLVDGAPEVLVLATDGGLRRWRDGVVVAEASAPGAGPRMDRVMRAYPQGDGLRALTPDALWQYDLAQRRWSEWRFQGAPAQVSQIDLVPDGAGVSLTLWDGTRGPMGAWSDLTGDTISFAPLRRPVLPQIPVAPAEILDLAEHAGRIAVLSERQLLLYPKSALSPDFEISLPAPQSGWSLGSDSTGDLVLVDGDSAAPLGLYRIVQDLRGKVTLDQAAARYIPGDDRAHAIISQGGGARILRIDRAMNTWDCSFFTGSVPTCDLLTGPPMALSDGDVVAFDTAQRILLTATDIWWLDAASRPLARLSGPVLSDSGQLLRNGTGLLYWEGTGRALWRFNNAEAELIASNVQAIRPAGDDLAALAGGQVFRLKDGEIVPPYFPAGLTDDQVLRSHFTSAGHVFVLASGGIMAKGGDLVSDPLLTFATDAVAVLPVPSGVGDAPQQWAEVGADGGLLIRFVGQCETPAPMPAPPPIEFIGPRLPLVIPPPIIAPCAQDTLLPLGLERDEVLMDIVRTQAGALQVLTNLRDVTLDDSGIDIARESTADLAKTPDKLRNDRPNGGFRTIDGQSWLNPPVIEQGNLRGTNSDRQLSLLAQTPLPAFDNGWLAWQRDVRQMLFSGGAQPVEMPLAEALVGGQFLPAQDARAQRLPGGGIAWMMPSGLWHQQGDRIWPVDLRRQDLPQGIDQGAFLGSQGHVGANGGAVAPLQPVRQFSAEGLDLSVDPLAGRVGVTLTVGGQAVDDAADQGFVHDRRLSVAQAGNAAFFLTPAGLVPLGTLTGGAAAAPDTRGLAAESGAVLAETGAGWLRLAGQQAGWVPTATPFQNARLAEENGRLWELRNGAVVITAADAWRIARKGLNFDFDQLLGFAATSEFAVAVTRSGTHAAKDIAGLQGALQPMAAVPSGLPLDSRRGKGERFYLYTTEGRIWDAGVWRDAAQDERPWQSRQAAAIGKITVDFDPAPRLLVEVTTIGDDLAVRLPFAWRRAGAMPFDEVTAFHADANAGSLLIGTRLGMRVLSPSGGGYANGPIRVPSQSGQAIAAGVVSAGRPDTNPDRVEVGFDEGTCAQLPVLTDQPQPCAADASLQTRFVALNDFWHVTKTADSVLWSYLADGMERPLNMPMGGHMPHDLLSDRMECAGVLTEVWHATSILRIGGGQFDLPDLRGLYCQPVAAKLDGGSNLQAGLYALLPGGAVRFDGAGFVPISGAEATALAERLAGRVVQETGRLRYGLEAGAPIVDHLSLAGDWRVTPWSAGRLVLDQPKALAWRSGLQVVTDAGVVEARGGVLDAATLVVMAGAVPETLAQCDVVRAETPDGRSHGLPATKDAPLRLYCEDGSWLEGVTDGSRDSGTFLPATAAATKRDLVDVTGLWSASAAYGVDGLPQAVEFTFRDEPARLGAGRFDFDTLQEIAAPFDGKIEMLTDSGWWRAPVTDPALRGTLRPAAPVAPRTVTGFAQDLSRRSGEPGLCLTTDDGKAQFWAQGAALEAASTCRDDRGRDGLWQWWLDDAQPRAVATSLNGVLLERALVAGRFSDVVLSGPPIVARDGALLVPGGLGVLVLDSSNGATRGIYALDAGGVLTRSGVGDPVWLARTGPVELTGETRGLAADALSCPALAVIPGQLPEGTSILRLHAGGAGWLQALVGGVDGRMQALIDCGDPAQSRLWSSRHDVSDHSRSLSLGTRRISLLQLGLVPGSAVLADGQSEAVVAGGPDVADFRGLATVLGGDELFVIDDKQLIAFSLSPAITYLALNGAVQQPSPDADVQSGADAAPDPSPDADAAAPAPSGGEPALEPPAPDDVPVVAPADLSPPVSAASEADEPAYDPAAVQAALAQSLSRRIVADGILGPRSRAAIADWQRQIGSEGTGFLSVGQLALLLAEGGG
jgi:hypothetical protein